jgi:hypothetical protein
LLGLLVLLTVSASAWLMGIAGPGSRASIWGLKRLVSHVLLGVLFVVDEIPPLHEMGLQIFDHRAAHAQRDVGPAHARVLCSIQLVVLPVHDVVEVHDSGVVVVLAREDDPVKVAGMHVGDGVLVGVPSSEAQVQAAHERDAAVYQTQFLVMGPVEDGVFMRAIKSLERVGWKLGCSRSIESQMLQRRQDVRRKDLAIRKMVGVTEHSNIWMERLQGMLRVVR